MYRAIVVMLIAVTVRGIDRNQLRRRRDSAAAFNSESGAV